jgi:hypothetical protein
VFKGEWSTELDFAMLAGEWAGREKNRRAYHLISAPWAFPPMRVSRWRNHGDHRNCRSQ